MPTPPAKDSDASRARTVVAALAVLVAMIAASAVVAALIDDDKPSTAPATTGTEEMASPAIIPKPDSGKAPEDPGDRGGWAQLAILGVIVATLGGMGFALARGTRRSRANRAAWLAAAESDHDGVLDHT